MTKTFEQGKEEVTNLCRYFATNHQAFLAPGVKEDHVRQSLIDPFFEALGWDVHNKARTAPQYQEVIPEDSLDVEGQQKAPDYTFLVGTLPKFYAEAKRCGVNIGADPAPAFQLRRYGFSGKLALSILTDFEELGVYDCTTRPRPSDKASHARIQYFRFDEYPDRWRELWDVFSREAVWSGAFDQYAASKRKRGTSEVDAEFLKDMEGWRLALAGNIALRNKELSSSDDPDDLNNAVQLTIDRVVFLRMAEDRGLEPYAQLLKLCERSEIYPRFMHDLCRQADEKYNSGLFHFQKESGVSEDPDRITTKLAVDDRVFKPILESLYFEHGSPYHFGILPVEILGTVYERFLGKVIRLTTGHQAKIEDKPEVRKAGGVYYTPAYIVEYIVKHTVGKQIEGRSPAQLAGSAGVLAGASARRDGGATFRVLDMACGSGSFLLGAYRCLLDYCLNWYIEHKPQNFKKAVYQDPRNGQWRLTIEEKKRILTTHIFGVDIDRQAVEVTKLSLLLKVLEGENDATLSMQRKLFYLDRALPNLADNIQCGNSLIGPDYFTAKLIEDLEELIKEMKLVNPFNWKERFPAAMKAGGFDCVIGNPPWGADLKHAERSYLSAKHPDVADFESSQYFLEKSASLLGRNGLLGMIIPNTFALNVYAKKFRDQLLNKVNLVSVLELSDVDVFLGPSVRSLVAVFGQGQDQSCRIFRSPAEFNARREIRIVSQKDLKAAETWKEYLVEETPQSRLASRLTKGLPALADFCEVRQGYIPYRTTTLTQRFGKVKAEEIVKKRLWHADKRVSSTYQKELQGADVGRYELDWSGVWVRYGEWVSTYLPISVFSGPRVLIREITGRAPHTLMAICTEDTYVHNPSVLAVLPKPHSPAPQFVAGILNSLLMSVIFGHVAPKAEKGLFPKIIITDARRLPFPQLNLSDAADKVGHDRMVKLVDSMLELHKQLAAAKSEAQKAIMQRQIDATDAEIDRLVYDLYGLTAEEITVVEGER